MNEPVFPSQRVALLSWAVNAVPSCHVFSCLWSLMPRRGEISCQLLPSQLSANGFINHAPLCTGEQLPFSRGLRHLWQRASSLLGHRIRKCLMSETRLMGAHCGRLMSPVFKVWRKWNFDRRDGKLFTCRVESAFAGLTAAGKDAERGCVKRWHWKIASSLPTGSINSSLATAMINVYRISDVETMLWAKSDLCYSSLSMDTLKNTEWTQGMLFMHFHGFFMDFSNWMWLRDSSWNWNEEKQRWGRLDWGRSLLRCGNFCTPLYICTELLWS